MNVVGGVYGIVFMCECVVLAPSSGSYKFHPSFVCINAYFVSKVHYKFRMMNGEQGPNADWIICCNGTLDKSLGIIRT